MDVLLAAGRRLAEALVAENAALASLDLARAASLAGAKLRATDAFAAAFAAAQKTGFASIGADRGAAIQITADLADLGQENRRLLAHAVTVQSRVIETIAAAALPRAQVGGYGAAGRRATAPTPAMALATRA